MLPFLVHLEEHCDLYLSKAWCHFFLNRLWSSAAVMNLRGSTLEFNVLSLLSATLDLLTYMLKNLWQVNTMLYFKNILNIYFKVKKFYATCLLNLNLLSTNSVLKIMFMHLGIYMNTTLICMLYYCYTNELSISGLKGFLRFFIKKDVKGFNDNYIRLLLITGFSHWIIYTCTYSIMFFPTI